MVGGSDHGDLLRSRDGGEQQVSPFELFFDLVYVFAVTQLSHRLLEDLTFGHALETLFLMMAVWWAWVYTAWVTNWFDPNRIPVRLMLVAVMLASLLMSVAIPDAFAERGLMFALAYVAIQVGRTLFVLAALDGASPLGKNFRRILFWLATSGALWIAGGLLEGEARYALWAIALAVEYAGPAFGFWTPGLGRTPTEVWNVEGGHLAERCQLFVIIALGESLLLTGATFAGIETSVLTVAALVVAFLGSVALWWIYFARAAEEARRIFAASADPGRIGRSAYTYFHLPIIAGIIIVAAADELVLAHPGDAGTPASVALALGGTALFLGGHAFFKWAVLGTVSYVRVVAVVALAALIPVGFAIPALALAVAAALIVVGVAVWDTLTHPVRARSPRRSTT